MPSQYLKDLDMVVSIAATDYLAISDSTTVLKKGTFTQITNYLSTYFDAAGSASAVNSTLSTHTSNVSNPHSVTKTQVGLANVDNTADTAKPVSTTQQAALNLKANLAGPTFTGTVAGITATMVGLSNVDNTSDVNKPVSTAQQAALDLKANLAGPTFTGTVVLPATASIGTVTAVELAYISGVTSAIQTQLNAKAPVSTTTAQGNTFNGVSQLVQLTAAGKLPAVDGSLITNLPSSIDNFVRAMSILGAFS